MGQSIIKVTVNSGGEEKSTFFSEEVFFIGDPKNDNLESSKSAYLPLTGIGLKPEHIKVFRQDSRIFVQNTANDPFVTLDNLPFYKKEAGCGSLLRIRDRDLKIELLQEKETLQTAPQKTTSSQKSFVNTPKPEETLENLKYEEEVFHAAPLPKAEASPPPLKEYDHFSDHDEKEDVEEKSWTSHLNVSPFRNIRLFSFFLMVFCLVFSVVAVESYLRAGERSDEDEVKAAESLADIAMALTYAQFYHISPQKHNWSDPAFIQNNLLATLPTGSSSGTILNCQGDFTGCSYFLRVYTSNDLSRFLVVAHPTPTLLQWLIPKSALVVDSNSMEIRRIRNVKAMNRLLANLNTLDGISLAQITDLIKNESLISLEYLAKMSKKPEFQPPKLLSHLRPGAENLIYNAPRYHPFGDALLKKVSHFASVHTSSHEIAMLQSELEILKKFPNLVLYTTKSVDEAKNAVNALMKIGPSKKYVLASIRYDEQGRFRSSKVVMDHDLKLRSNRTESTTPYIAKAAVFPVPHPPTSEVALLSSSIAPESLPTKIDEINQDKVAELDPNPPETVDPLLTKLKAIASEKEASSNQIKASAYKAVDKYIKRPRKKILMKRLNKAVNLLKEEEMKVKEMIFEISIEEENNLENFEELLKQSGLKGMWNGS